MFSNNGLFSKITRFLIYFKNWQATEWGKCYVKDGKKDRVTWFREECQIVVPDVMLFNFVKLTLSLIKP